MSVLEKGRRAGITITRSASGLQVISGRAAGTQFRIMP